MVKTPHTRHSKTSREPMTIDLAPGEVARVKAEQEAAAATQTQAPGNPAPEEAERSSAGDMHEGETASFAGPGEEPSEAAARDPETSSAASDFHAGRPPRHDKPADTSPPPSNEPVRGGMGKTLASGLAGGVAALLLAGGLQVAGILPRGGEPAPDTAGIEARLEELRGQVAELEQGTGHDTALAERVAAAEQGIASLTSDLEALRGEVGANQDGGAPVDLGPIEERIAAIETAVAGLGGNASSEADLAALDERIDTLRGEIGSAREAQAAATQRLDALERSVSDLSSRLEQQAEAPGTAVIIAASALKAAIDRGGPFMTELETFASLAPEAPEVAQLRDMAAAGVPTRAQIAGESDAAANAMIAAARPTDANAGVVDRLWGSAMGLVQVRPIGMVEGDGVPEIVARIDAAVSSNDYQRAIDEFETLPDAAKSAGEAFIARVKARHSADTLIDQALASALKVKG